MKTSIEGIVALMGHEGIVESRYKDSKGVWTIGIGHTAMAGGLDPATYYGKLTLQQIMDMLLEDIKKYENAVNKVLKVPVKQSQFDALVSFHYNTGAIGKASLMNKLNAGDVKGAAAGFLDWKKPPEIIKRREAEYLLFRDGVYPSPKVTIYPASASGAVQWKKGKVVNAASLLSDKTIVARATPPAQPVEPKVIPMKPITVSPVDHAGEVKVTLPETTVTVPVDSKPAKQSRAGGIMAILAIILTGIASYFGLK